jgi:hypothetical protein
MSASGPQRDHRERRRAHFETAPFDRSGTSPRGVGEREPADDARATAAGQVAHTGGARSEQEIPV